MGFSDNVGLYQNYHYTIDEFYHSIGNNIKYFTENAISSISIIDDYVSNILPIIRIHAIMSDSMYYRIIKCGEEGVFHIRIGTYHTNADGTNKSLKRVYLTKNFKMLSVESQDDFTRMIEEVDKTNQITKDELDLYKSQLAEVNIFLYDLDLAKKIHNNVNYIFHNVSVYDAFSAMIKNQDITNILVSPFYNITPIDQIIIPIMPFTKAIQYLSDYYGIYQYGSLLYFGLRRNYLLSLHSSIGSVYTEDELKTISIPIITSTEKIAPATGKYVNGSTGYYRADSDSVHVLNGDIESVILTGKDITIIDPYENTINNLDIDHSSINSDGVRYIMDYIKNPYVDTTIKYLTSLEQMVIQVAIGNIDISDITPNKNYKILVDDSKIEKKYRGDYKLLHADISIIRDSGDYVAMASLKLAKCNNN